MKLLKKLFLLAILLFAVTVGIGCYYRKHSKQYITLGQEDVYL